MAEELELLAALHQLELRVVALLREAASLIESAEAARQPEERKQVLVAGRTYAQHILTLKTDFHRLIDRMPRADYPRRRLALRDRYLDCSGSVKSSIESSTESSDIA